MKLTLDCDNMFCAGVCLLLPLACCYHFLATTLSMGYHLFTATACLLELPTCQYLLDYVTGCSLVAPACCCPLPAATYSKFNHLFGRYNITVATECVLVKLALCYHLLTVSSCCYILLVTTCCKCYHLADASTCLLVAFSCCCRLLADIVC